MTYTVLFSFSLTLCVSWWLFQEGNIPCVFPVSMPFAKHTDSQNIIGKMNLIPLIQILQGISSGLFFQPCHGGEDLAFLFAQQCCVYSSIIVPFFRAHSAREIFELAEIGRLKWMQSILTCQTINWCFQHPVFQIKEESPRRYTILRVLRGLTHSTTAFVTISFHLWRSNCKSIFLLGWFIAGFGHLPCIFLFFKEIIYFSHAYHPLSASHEASFLL